MKFLAIIVLCLLMATRADAQFGPVKSSGEFPVSGGTSPVGAIAVTMVSGEWKKIPNSDIRGIGGGPLLTEAQHNAIVLAEGGANFWGQSSSVSVLDKWNSAAFDPSGNRWFFMGGGHADYGGNEVYEFDFDTLEWTRLTEPAPLTVEHSSVPGAYIPDGTPISPHTYDSLTWNTTTQTLWTTQTSSGFNSLLDVGVPGDPASYWEFDPDTGQWTQHISTNASENAGLFIPGEDVVLILRSPTYTYQRWAYTVAANGTETALNGGAVLPGSWDWGWAGNLFVIPESASSGMAGRIFIAADVMTEYSLDATANTITQVGSATAIPSLGFSVTQAGYVFRSVDEKVYIWNGGREVYTWDPATNTYATLANSASPVAPNAGLDGYGRIFDKWIYLEQEDVFAGIHDADDGGIWLWKP